jgi:hypothetical protein
MIKKSGKNLWRGDLAKRRTAPLGCAAVVNPEHAVFLKD